MNVAVKPWVFALILVSVVASALAQLMLKTGMSQPAVLSALDSGRAVDSALRIAFNPWIVGGFTLYLFGAVVWLFVLARVDASFAYPFVGVGFIVTLLLGKLLMGDAIGVARLVGTALVAVGVVCIAAGGT